MCVGGGCVCACVFYHILPILFISQEALLVSLYYFSLTSTNVSRVDYNVCRSSKGHGYPTSDPIILVNTLYFF